MKLIRTLIIFLFFLTSINTHNAYPQKLKSVKVSYVALGGGQGMLWVTKEANVFEKYGINAQLIYIESEGKAVPALIAGEVQVMQSASTGVTQAAIGGAEIVIIGAFRNVYDYMLFVNPTIQKPQDLKGKKLGVNRYGATADFVTRRSLERVGLVPDKDVAIVQVGGQTARLITMKQGGIHGTMVNPLNISIFEKQGFKPLLNTAELGVPGLGDVITTSKEYYRTNQDTLINILKALIEGVYVYKTQRDFAVKVISKYTKLSDLKAIASAHKIYTDSIEKIPYVKDEGIRAVMQDLATTNPKAKQVDVKDFVDNSLVKKIEESGFIKTIYR